MSSWTKSYLHSKQNGFDWLTGKIDPTSICKHTTSEQEQQIDATSSSVPTTARIPLYKNKQKQNIGRHAVFFFTFIWTHPVMCFWWFPTVLCYWPLMGLLKTRDPADLTCFAALTLFSMNQLLISNILIAVLGRFTSVVSCCTVCWPLVVASSFIFKLLTVKLGDSWQCLKKSFIFPWRLYKILKLSCTLNTQEERSYHRLVPVRRSGRREALVINYSQGKTTTITNIYIYMHLFPGIVW